MIKFYYNVGGFFEDMQFELIELLNMFFKDEVCVFGIEFGILDEIVWCQFFSGLGFGICVFGEVIEEKLEIVCELDVILCEEVVNYGLECDIW